MEAKIRANRGVFMGKWKRKGLVLHWKEKSETGLSVKYKERREEKGGTFGRGHSGTRGKKLRKNQREK